MGINVLISSARECKEKKLIKRMLEKHPDIEHVYDCNDTPTDYNREETKQQEIDHYIRHRTDWFIFLCPYDFVGQATFHELEVAVNASSSKLELPMVSIFFSAVPDEELRLRNEQLEAERQAPITYDRRRDKTRADIEALLNPDPNHRHYFPDPYAPGQLLEAVQKEFVRFVNNGLRMRRFETFCSDILPTDIFYDPNRTKEENGFDDHYFLRLPHYDEMMKQGNNHMLICGSPASGKTRSVYEYLRSWGRDTQQRNVFISVRLARNLGAGEEGHHCISLHRLVDELKLYNRYLDKIGDKVNDKARHFIVIDQVDSMIGSDFNLLADLFKEATSSLRPNYQILLTSTPSGYDRIASTLDENRMLQSTDNTFQSTLPLSRIDISPLSFGDAREIWDNLSVGDERRVMPKGMVVGDFVPKLRKYTDRLLENARVFDCVLPAVRHPYKPNLSINTIGAFVRSVQVVKRMRRSQAIPLCLCLMFMEQMTGDDWQTEGRTGNFRKCFAEDLLKVMNGYFIRYNILRLDFAQEAAVATVPQRGRFACVTPQKKVHPECLVDTDLDFDKECVYDKESMVTLVSPTITLSFVNDKAWDELEQVYQFDYKPIMLSNGNRTVSLHAREEARRAMDIWYRTFASYAPWTTLLRMLTRSPLNALDKLQNRVWDDDGEDNASYVENLYHEMMRSLVRLPKAIHDELLNDRNRVFLESLLTASKRNVEDIRREVFISGTTVKSQYLNYSFVGELYKKAFDRARLCGYRKPLDEKIIRQMRVKDPKTKSRVDDYVALADEVLRAFEAETFQTNPADAKERSDEFYYYSRKILQCDTFNEAYGLFFDDEKLGLVAAMGEINEQYRLRKNPEDQLTFAHKSCDQIMSSMCALIVGDYDFDKWMELARQTRTDITLANIMQMIGNSLVDVKHGELQRKLFVRIIQTADEALRQGNNYALANIVRTSGVKIICEMIKQASSLVAARKIKNLVQPWLDDGLVIHTKDTPDIWETVALGRMQPYEYPFLLKEITKNNKTGEIKDPWASNEQLRDALLLCPSNLSDTIELYCRLYENTDEAKIRKVTPYTVANFFKNVRRKYWDVKQESINSSFEAFMQMMNFKKIRDCVKRIVNNGEVTQHNFVLDVYNSVVTAEQETCFIDYIGQNAWDDLCRLPKVNSLRIGKERIYDIDKVIEIVGQVVRDQKQYAVISDDLVNNAVVRLNNTPKGSEYDKLRNYLRALLTEDKAYVKALVKSQNFYRTCHTLKVPVRHFHSFNAKEDNSKVGIGRWCNPEQLELCKNINDKLGELSQLPSVNKAYADNELPKLLDMLGKLRGSTAWVVPNIIRVLDVLKNAVVRFAINAQGRKVKMYDGKKNIQPTTLMELVSRCYTDRQLPITTTIVNALLEGFVNYYEVAKMAQSREHVRQLFWNFITDKAPYVRLDALSYKHILALWPCEAERHKATISQLADCNEQLMNILVKKRLLTDVADWNTRWQKHIRIVGQKM